MTHVIKGYGEVNLKSDEKEAKPVKREELEFILENFNEVEYEILRAVDKVSMKQEE